MKKIRFLISTTFAVLSVALLMQEGKDVRIQLLGELTTKIFDRKQANTSERLLFERRVKQGYAYSYTVDVEKGVLEESIEMLSCLPLKAIFGNGSELDLDLISDNLLEFFNRTFYAINQMNSSQINVTFASKLNQFDRSIMGPLKSRNYYLVRDRFCLALPLFRPASSILDDLFKSGLYFVFLKHSYSFIQLQPGIELNLTLVMNDQNPNFDCSSNHTQFQCLNDCLKAQRRLSRYFYRGNESGIVQLNYEPAARQESICFQRCKKNHCFHLKVDKKATGFSRFQLDTQRRTVSISPSSYWIQFVGLLLSFFGLCIYRLALWTIRLVCLRENRKKLLLVVKILLVLLCLLVFRELSDKVSSDFGADATDFKVKFSIQLPSSPDELNLVLCVPVIHAMNHFNETNEIDLLSQHKLENKLKELNFSELESRTDDAFGETVDEIHLETLGRRSKVSYRLLDKVLFWTEKETTGLFSRCFQLVVNPNEPRYLGFLRASRLTIILKHQLYTLYLLPDSRTFHSAAYRHSKLYRFQKVIISSSSQVCPDYRVEQLEGRSKCDSFANCVDQCALEEVVKGKRNLSVNNFSGNNLSVYNVSVYNLIDKQLFSSDQWSGLFPDFSEEGKQKYSQTKSDCKWMRKDCVNVLYKKDDWLLTDFNPNQTVEDVKLSHSIATYFIDLPSYLTGTFDLLTVQGILFDLNAHQLLIAIVLFLLRKLHLKPRNAFLLPIHLLCGAGFGLHIWMLFNLIQHDQIVLGVHKNVVNSKSVSELLFCVDIDSSLIDASLIDKQLTGNHLEEVTKNLTIESIFRAIRYRTNENEWKELTTVNDSNLRTDHPIIIDTAYFFDRKCFRISNTIEYELGQFYFNQLEDLRVLPVLSFDFNESFVRPIVLFTKTPDKLFMSEPIRLNKLASNVSHWILQNSHQIISQDRFFFLRIDSYRSLSALFPQRDVHSYLTNLKAKFKREHRATTTELPLTREEFDLPINDTLFRQFYEQVQYPKDQQTPAGFVYEREMFTNSVSETNNSFDSDVVYSISFSETKLEYRNENNLAKFILSNLNALSLWFGLNIFSPFALELTLFRGASSSPKVRRRISRSSSGSKEAAFELEQNKLVSESLPNIWTIGSTENFGNLKEDQLKQDNLKEDRLKEDKHPVETNFSEIRRESL